MTRFSEKLVTGSVDAQENIKNNFINPTEVLDKAWKYSNWHTHSDCLNTIIGCNVKKQYKYLYKHLYEYILRN